MLCSGANQQRFRAAETLQLTACHIGPEGARELENVLQNNKKIYILHLNDNSIKDKGTKYIAR